ncbi:hypothetical protein ACLKA7_007337 [Drosophila subpalustris]
MRRLHVCVSSGRGSQMCGEWASGELVAEFFGDLNHMNFGAFSVPQIWPLDKAQQVIANCDGVVLTKMLRMLAAAVNWPKILSA